MFLVFPGGSQKKVKVCGSFGTQSSCPPTGGLGSTKNSRRYVVPMLTPNNLKQAGGLQNEPRNKPICVENFLLTLIP